MADYTSRMHYQCSLSCYHIMPMLFISSHRQYCLVSVQHCLYQTEQQLRSMQTKKDVWTSLIFYQHQQIKWYIKHTQFKPIQS